MDVDGDGMLTKDEIIKGYKKYISHLGGVVSTHYVSEMFDEADVDKSGSLAFEEFIAFAVDHESIKTKAALQKAFDAMDKDKSGSLDIEEIRNLIGSFGQEYSSDAAAQLITHKYDTDGDGLIDFEEFCMFM